METRKKQDDSLPALPSEETGALKILHVNTARTWRGGEQQVLYLALALREMGIEQAVAVKKGSELESRCREENIETIPFPFLGEWDFYSGLALGFLSRKGGFTIIHAHTARAHTLGLYATRIHRSVKLLVSRRVDFPSGKNRLSKRKYLSRAVSLYLAISQNVKNILIQDGIPEDRIRVAYSGIDTARFAEKKITKHLQSEFHVKENEIIIGNVAACVPHKDQLTLLRAIEVLEKRNDKKGKKLPDYRLFLVGEGELRKSLEAEARKTGLFGARRVVFTGFRKDVESFYSLFDIFVMSSKEEGLGTSVLDAMASGLPVAVTDGGGLSEMIDEGKGGFISPVGDAERLADSLEKLLLSDATRKKFGKYNLNRVRDFHYETTARDTVKVYRELLQ